MEFKDVESSNIKAIAFDEGKLYVTFIKGNTYSYDSTEDEFKKFLESESKGKFFSSNIKGRPFDKPDLTKLQENKTSE